jgi:uncharacterized protein
MTRRLSLAQARRTTIAAQGLDRPPSGGAVDVRHLRRAVGRLGALQIDSVNVVARAHLLTLHARLGAFDPALLDDAAYRRRELVEYWAHEAAYVPVALHPLLRWRMAEIAARPRSRIRALLEQEPGYLGAVRDELAERGPLTASELRDPGGSAGSWWGWSKGKVALEWLFAIGEVAVADRRAFARVYDLAERVIPADVLGSPTPPPEAALRALLLIAARCQGVGTAADLADHFRVGVSRARPILTALVRAGELVEAAVDGWEDPAYLHPDVRVPRHVDGRALLCPFDPLVWCRPRLERLFGMRYRIEIYTPAERRVHGYYVLPFLLGEELAARVDLKADRAGGRLLVRAAHREPSAPRPGEVAEGLADALAAMAAWSGLGAVAVEDRGDLAGELGRVLHRREG